MQVYLEAISEKLQFMEDEVVPEEEILAPLQHILEILNKDEKKEDSDYGTDII